jgi:tetratricopeptide (TPR) repeat protein
MRRLLIPLLACVATEAAALSPTELYARASQTVLLLEGRDAGNTVQLQATAIALGDGLAATQCNLLANAPTWQITQGTRNYAAYPRERDEARNLCRLDVPGLRAPQPQVATGDQVQVGQRVYAIGNALGLGLSLSEGLVSGIRSFSGEAWIQTTAALASGSEGGALFDESGRLVGVTDYGRRDGQNVNFAAPATWLAEIPARHGQPDRHARTLAEANRLAAESDWKGLAALATDWTRRAPEHADAWLWLGHAHEALSAFSAAAGAFDKALAITPDSVSAALGLARNQLRQQQTEAAAATLARILSTQRVEAEVWFLQGFVETARGQADAADAAWREAVRLDPRHFAAWQQRFGVAFGRGDYRAAQQFATHLTEIQPEHFDAWLWLADAQLQLQRPERALRAIDRASEIDPDQVETEMFRGHAFFAQRRYADAIAAYRRALAGTLRMPAIAWAGLGNVYYRLQQFPDAIAALREAVRLAPDALQYQADLGIALKDGGHDEEALTLFVAMRDKAPQDPFPWRQIGFVQSKLGRYAEAGTALEQSLRLAPDQAKVWHALAEGYAMTDRADDVRRIYQRLRGLDAERAEQLYRNFLLPFETLPANPGDKP